MKLVIRDDIAIVAKTIAFKKLILCHIKFLQIFCEYCLETFKFLRSNCLIMSAIGVQDALLPSPEYIHVLYKFNHTVYNIRMYIMFSLYIVLIENRIIVLCNIKIRCTRE